MYDGGSRVDRGRGGMLRPSAGHSGRSTGLCIQPANRETHLSFVDPDEARMRATASTASLTSHVAWIALGTSAAHAHAQTLYFSVGFPFIRGTVEVAGR